MYQVRIIYFLCLSIGFSSFGISSSPANVQAQKVSLQFYGTAEQTVKFNAGKSYVRITVPSDVVWYSSGVICYDMMLKQNCTMQTGPNSFTVFLSQDLLAGKQFQYRLDGAINNPDSEQPTTSFKIETSAGEQISTGLIITATRGSMKKFLLSPQSQIVGDSTNLEVRWRAEHSIPKGGYVLLQFPKWNPSNPVASSQKSYIQGSEKCTPLAVLPTGISCDFSQDQLVLSGVAPLQQLASGIELAFQVTGFKNPIDTDFVYGFKIQTAIKSNTGVFYVIDEANTSFSVSEFATLSQARLFVQDPTILGSGVIQAVDKMQLDFFLPVPLNAGCIVNVILPKQYSLDHITEVSTLKAFGFYKHYTVSDGSLILDTVKNSFKINACSAYVENDLIATIEIDSLKQYNYESPSDSVIIQIENQLGNPIAQIESGVNFTPKRGYMGVTATSSNPIVQEPTMISFTFKPQHEMQIQDDPQIVIEFPAEVQISSVQCIVNQIFVNGASNSSPVQCTRFNQSLTVKQFLMTDYTPSKDSYFQFTIGQVTNPISIQPVTGLKITLMAFGMFAIDQYQGSITWNIVVGSFQSGKVVADSYVAFQQDVTYTITFSPQHSIPQNGYIDVHIPAQIFIPDKSYTQSSCRALPSTGFPTTQITCQFLTTQTSGYNILRILQAFRRIAGQGNTSYVFVLPGIQNPIYTQATSSFKFYSYTNNASPIDVYESGVTIQMLENAKLQTVQVTLGNYDNAAHTNYTFTMVPSIPITQNNFILMTFPSQIVLPANSSDFNCTSTFTALLSSVICSYSNVTTPNTVRVDLKFAEKVQTISPLDRFAFTMNNIQNPSTMKPTDSIVVNVNDPFGIPVNSMKEGVTVTTSNSFIVKKAQVLSSSQNPGRASNFEITFFAQHSIQTGGGILIVYPPQITTLQSNSTLLVQIQIPGLTINPKILQTQQEPSARAILVYNVIQGNQTYIPSADNPIKITLVGLRNPFTNVPTDSFSVQTFDTYSEQGQLNFYFIDKKANELVIFSKCNYPCKNCNSDQADICTECYDDSDLPFLQLGVCVKECATSRYYNSQLKFCDACDQTCLQCSGSKTSCTKCGVDDFLYLNQKDRTCLKFCPDGMLEDSGKNLCINCNENCKTCENTVDACTSCNQLGQWPYFFHDNCISACASQISVLVGNQCVECHSSCKTCAGLPTSCTSCEPYMKFDPSKGTCAEMCTSETQIYVPNLTDKSQSGTCEFCNPTCSKCAGTVNTCSLCQPGYVLNLDFTCQKTCNHPDGTPATDQTAILNVCQKCAEPCNSCSDQISTCTSCHPEWLLFQASSCVYQYCPKKWVANPEKTKCVWEGLSCPKEFDINQTGDGCIPKNFDCKPGYTINKERSACIPNPGSPVPFPFILASIFLSFLVLGSYIKDKFATKVLTNLIALVGCFEIFMYSLMVIFAYTQSQWVIMLITIAGIIGLVVANIIWVCWYKQQILQDEAFQKWLHFFPNTKRAMPVFCLLLNFKTCKMFYSGFYGLESTMAKFGDQQTFYRVMRTTTYFSWVFCYLPIFIADVIIFIKVKWGFQLLILAIETVLLQTISIILTIIEFRQGYQKLLSPPGEQYAQFKQGKEMKVMGVDDDDDYEEGLPDFEQETLIRSRLKVEERETELRRKAFSQILSQVGVTFENHNSTDQEKKQWKLQQEFQACVSNFDQKRLKYRRAFSLSDGSDQESWVCNGDRDDTGMHLDDSPQLARRYSYPLSPRVLAVIPDKQLFQKQIADIKQANEAFLIDNVYTEVATRPVVIPRVKVKTVSRRTQTYLRELMQVDAEELHESDMEVLMEEEAEIQADFAHSLINNVIDGISNHSEDQTPVEIIQEEPVQKKRIFKAKKEIPDFELNDIMGQFEIDELGNFIIMRGEGGELMDKMERLVNRRGYLVDRFGNVINNQGNIIFKGVELDVDDEIPAPFGFEKRKKNILKLFDDNKFTIENMPDQPGQMDESFEVIDEENLNRELQSIREKSQMHEDAKDEIKAEVRQGNLTVEDLDASPSGQDQSGAQLSLENLDQVIEKVTKKKVAQKKDKLKGQNNKKKKNTPKLNNMPPKRIKQGDLTEMFPTIGIENEEQRRLARLAGAIGGLASQLAKNTRQQTGAQMQTYQDRTNERSYFEEQLGMVKQEQLNEILNDQDEMDLNVEQQRSMLQDRPNSNYSLLGGSTAHRKNMSMERAGTSNAVNRQTYAQQSGSRGAKRGSNLQKVYGNIVDLIGFEEQHITDMVNQRGRSPGLDQLRRVGSGKPQQRKDNVENIYMNASKHKNGKGVIKSDLNPFRPTLNRFADDPAELNVDTTMNGEHQGKDISLMIADNLDKMQRDYLQGAHGQLIAQQSQPQFQGNRPITGTMHNTLRHTNSEMAHQEDFMMSGAGVINPTRPHPIVMPQRVNPFAGSDPNSRLQGAQSQKHSHMDQIIRGNWVARDYNV